MNRDGFRILVVDDERSFLRLLTKILEDSGYTVRGIADPEDALNAIEDFSPNLVVTDLKMPRMNGIEFMTEARKKLGPVDFIILTAYATVETAVEAIKKGATDYLIKPLKDPEQLRLAVAKVAERQNLLSENTLLKSGQFQNLPPLDVIFAGMEKTLAEIREVAPTDATVMLLGETGTGKSLIAKAIHILSGRQGPFVDINCAAIPENLLESELFGHEKGAFTGAFAQKRGKFELAAEGTIFLDEVSEMGPALQGKLLRVLQERTFERLGSLVSIRSTARVIAATNKNLRELVSERTFREDLYYRLHVFPVQITPLRERISWLPPIANYLAATIATRLGKGPKMIPDDEMEKLVRYAWPGNIRELENLIERSIIISRTERLSFPPFSPSDDLPASQGTDLRTVEMRAIENALDQTGGNRRKTAEILGISLRSLQYKLKEYGIVRKT